VCALGRALGCVAANTFHAIIQPSVHRSLVGNHTLETE
jgi:hypothetical protein